MTETHNESSSVARPKPKAAAKPRRSKFTVEQWAKARAVIEAGGSYREAMEAGGFPNHETIRYRAKREKWATSDRTPDDSMSSKTAKLVRELLEQFAEHQAAPRAWRTAQSAVADIAGETARLLPAVIVDALDRGQDKLARAAAYAFGQMVANAQLLSGEATSRMDVTTSSREEREERVSALIVDLGERRKAAEAS